MYSGQSVKIKLLISFILGLADRTFRFFLSEESLENLSEETNIKVKFKFNRLNDLKNFKDI